MSPAFQSFGDGLYTLAYMDHCTSITEAKCCCSLLVSLEDINTHSQAIDNEHSLNLHWSNIIK